MKNSRFTIFLVLINVLLFFNCSSENKRKEKIVITEIQNKEKNISKTFYVKEFFNNIESRINNGILEGINSKIQLAKKRARGYRNIKNFINMVYFICGKLKFDYPLYLV